MPSTFQHSIGGDISLGVLDSNLLQLEIVQDSIIITAFAGLQLGVGEDPDRFDTFFAASLPPAEEAQLHSLVDSHDPANPKAFPLPPAPGTGGSIDDGPILAQASAGIFGAIPPLGLPPSAWSEKGEMEEDTVIYARTLYPAGVWGSVDIGIVKDGGSSEKLEVAFYADDGAVEPTLPFPTGTPLATTGLQGTPSSKDTWLSLVLDVDLVLQIPTWLWSALIVTKKKKPRLLAAKKLSALWYGRLFLTAEDMSSPLGVLPGTFDDSDDSSIPYVGLRRK